MQTYTEKSLNKLLPFTQVHTGAGVHFRPSSALSHSGVSISTREQPVKSTRNAAVPFPTLLSHYLAHDPEANYSNARVFDRMSCLLVQWKGAHT